MEARVQLEEESVGVGTKSVRTIGNVTEFPTVRGEGDLPRLVFPQSGGKSVFMLHRVVGYTVSGDGGGATVEG